jgi:serine/threonine protein kinase
MLLHPQANNPFVVRFYYSFSSPEKLFLVMEYCPGAFVSPIVLPVLLHFAAY